MKNKFEKKADKVGLILAVLAVPVIAWIVISYFDVVMNNGPFGEGPQLVFNFFKLISDMSKA